MCRLLQYYNFICFKINAEFAIAICFIVHHRLKGRFLTASNFIQYLVVLGLMIYLKLIIVRGEGHQNLCGVEVGHDSEKVGRHWSVW